MFTHFGKASDDWCMSHEVMFMVLCHNMAIFCQEWMEFMDLCITIHCCKPPLSRQITNSILVSIKDKVDAIDFIYTSVDINKDGFLTRLNKSAIYHPIHMLARFQCQQ